jgi:integrase
MPGSVGSCCYLACELGERYEFDSERCTEPLPTLRIEHGRARGTLSGVLAAKELHAKAVVSGNAFSVRPFADRRSDSLPFGFILGAAKALLEKLRFGDAIPFGELQAKLDGDGRAETASHDFRRECVDLFHAAYEFRYSWNRTANTSLGSAVPIQLNGLFARAAAALLRELPEHLKDIATFALATGLRAANITGLTWEQVDLPRKRALVHPDQAKARRAIPVPFNEAALEFVTRQQGKHSVHVFTYEGNQVKQVSTRAWYKALKRAGVEAFRFHDLRHYLPTLTMSRAAL